MGHDVVCHGEWGEDRARSVAAQLRSSPMARLAIFILDANRLWRVADISTENLLLRNGMARRIVE